MAQQIELPYFYLSQGQITILIDSGASESIISSKIAKLYPKNIFLEPFEVIACKKTYKENKNLEIPLLQELLGLNQNFKLSIINWHNDFDALLGNIYKFFYYTYIFINYENKTFRKHYNVNEEKEVDESNYVKIEKVSSAIVDSDKAATEDYTYEAFMKTFKRV